jgi:hypothetical protein
LEGLILANSNLVSGEVFQIGNDKFSTMSTRLDEATDELFVSAAETNTSITHQRYEESVRVGKYCPGMRKRLILKHTCNWTNFTAELRQVDPGLLDNARYMFHCKNLGNTING